MNKRQDAEKIRRALDASLSGLQDDPWLAQRVVAAAKGEKKVKKKISVGLAVALVLATLAATALAVVTLHEAARLIAQTEQDNGNFCYWPVEKKAAVVSALIDQGYIEETDALRQMREGALSDDEASAAADAAVEAFTGMETEEIGFMSLMQTAWGPFDTWSDEDKAWYSEVMEDVGVESDGKTVYVLPEGKIGKEDAVQIAKREIASAYQVDEGALDGYRVAINFQVPEFAEEGGDQAYWYVMLEAPQDMEDRLFNAMELFIHPQTGELLETVEEIIESWNAAPKPPDNALYQRILAYAARAEEAGAYAFRNWPLELRAAYSQEITPQVQAILESGDLTDLMNCGHPDIEVIAQSSYIYGIPDENAIAQEDAYARAKAALTQVYDLPADLFEKYHHVYVYYDVTAAPKWKFFFNPNEIDEREIEGGWDNPIKSACYRAEIDAYTGDTLCVEQFGFQFPGHDLAYDLKWY